MTTVTADRVVVELEAKVRQAQAEVQKYRDEFRASMADVRRSAEQAETATRKSTESIGGYFRGLAGIVSADLILRGLNAIVEGINNIGEVASRVGITTDELQALQEQARKTGATNADMNKAVQAAAEQAANKVSYLNKLFEANGRSTRDAAGNMRPMIDILRDFSDLVQNAGSDAERLAITTGVFGDKLGRELVEVFAQGRTGAITAFNDMIRAGRNHSEAQIAEIQRIKRAFDDLWDRAALGAQRMVVDTVQNVSNLERVFNSLEFGKGPLEDLRQIRILLRQIDKPTMGFDPNDPTNYSNEGRIRGPGMGVQREQVSNVGRKGDLGPVTVLPTDKQVVRQALLDLIGQAEGTDPSPKHPNRRGYNETLGYGAFTGGPVNLTTMTIDEVLQLQRRMLAQPGNNFGGRGSSAVGRYQITSETLRDFMPRLGLKGNDIFDERTQDLIASAIAEKAGRNAERLRGRWEGLKNVGSDTILSAFDDSSRDRVQARKAELKAISDAEEEDLKAKEERNRRIVEIFNDQQRQQEVAVDAFQRKQEEAAKASAVAWDEAGAMISGAIQGLASDLMNGVDAGEAFHNMLMRLADAGINSLLSVLFQGGPGGGGLFGGLLQGRAGGGPVNAGQAYVVGEKRPELFVPRQSGYIVPQIPNLSAMMPQRVIVEVQGTPDFEGRVIGTSVARADRRAARRDVGMADIMNRQFPGRIQSYQQLGTVSA